MNRTTCLYFRTHGTSWAFMTNCFSRGRIETSFTNNRTNRLIQTTEKEQQVRFITYSYLRFLPVIICEVVVVVVYCQGIELVTATCYACMFYLTNRLHFSLRVYCNRSQMTFNSTKCTTREEVEWLDLTSSMCVSSNRSRTITNENHIIVSKNIPVSRWANNALRRSCHTVRPIITLLWRLRAVEAFSTSRTNLTLCCFQCRSVRSIPTRNWC